MALAQVCVVFGTVILTYDGREEQVPITPEVCVP
jgi:hypothetical protein